MKRINRDIEEFEAKAKLHGLTYAQAQKQETLKMIEKGWSVPAHYSKIGDRKKEEIQCS